MPFEERLIRWPEFRPLQERLLQLGGTVVALVPEPYLVDILGRGRSFSAHDVDMREGEAGHCHQNVARLYGRSGTVKVVTGWALSDDGIWRAHSWGLEDERIIETTTARTLYFGFVMTDLESVRFVIRELRHPTELGEAHPRFLRALRELRLSGPGAP